MLDRTAGLSYPPLRTLIISQISDWLKFYHIPGALIMPNLGLGRCITKGNNMLIYVNKS